MRRVPLIGLAAAFAVALASPASAAAPGDLSTDPLDRGVLLALPSVYRVDVTIRVDGLRLRDGARVPLEPAARTVREHGTAVAVASGGWLVTAGHVAAPGNQTVARLVYQSDLALRGRPHGDQAAATTWVRTTGARPVGAEVQVRVRPADAGAGVAATGELAVRKVVGSPTADLALIRVDAPRAPALDLAETYETGTPVATVGFGRGSALTDPVPGDLEPTIRRGAIIRRGLLENDVRPDRDALAISVPVEHGDSGGPVIDAHGDVRGIVIQRATAGGYAELATEVRGLLDRAGAPRAPSESAKLFRDGMQAFWGLDFAAAGALFELTLREDPRHAAAAVQRGRAEALAGGDLRLTGRGGRGLLIGVGVAAAVAALACAAALALILRAGRGPAASVRRGPEGGGGR